MYIPSIHFWTSHKYSDAIGQIKICLVSIKFIFELGQPQIRSLLALFLHLNGLLTFFILPLQQGTRSMMDKMTQRYAAFFWRLITGPCTASMPNNNQFEALNVMASVLLQCRLRWSCWRGWYSCRSPCFFRCSRASSSKRTGQSGPSRTRTTTSTMTGS